jgi:hypothetical protein
MGLACEVIIAGRRQPAVVLDVSMGGLFVQTSTAIELGTALDVEFRLPGSETAIALSATVARVRSAPPNLTSASASWAGLQITRASAEYYAFLSELTSTQQVK